MVIGDVAGHDMTAAARMGQLRSVLRAYIVDRHEPPSALLRRMDVANYSLGEPVLATAVIAVIDTPRRRRIPPALVQRRPSAAVGDPPGRDRAVAHRP